MYVCSIDLHILVYSPTTISKPKSISCNLCVVDLTRQYKTMQTQHESRIEFLESQVRRLQHELGMCDNDVSISFTMIISS